MERKIRRRRKKYRKKLLSVYGFNFGINNIKTKKIIILSTLLSFLIISILLSFRYNSYTAIEEHIENKQYTKSLQLINELLRENKDDYYPLKQKANIYTMLALEEDIASYDYEAGILGKEAIAIYEKLIEQGAKDFSSKVYFFMALNCFFIGKEEYKRGLSFIEKAILLNKTDKEIDNYIKDKEKLVINIDNRKYYFTLNGLCGYLSFQIGDYEKSLGYFKKAIAEEEHHPPETIYNLYLGLSYFNIKHFESAKNNLLIIINEEKNTDILEHSYFLLSNIAFNEKKYKESAKYIKLAIEINPSADNYYQIGLIYERQNNLKAAFSFWSKALDLDPGNSKARQRIIRFEKKLKKRN